MNDDYSHGSKNHVELAARILEALIAKDIYGRMSVEDRASALAAEAFAIAKAFTDQVSYLYGGRR
jgi:hypothetical protein